MCRRTVRGTRGLEAFLEIWGREILRMEMEPLDDHPLDVNLTLRVLPRFAMASGSLSPMCNRHTDALVDNDDLVLVLIERGSGAVHQHGRAAHVAEGEAVLTANGEGGTFAGLTPTRVVNFRLSRSLLAAYVKQPDDRVARPIARDSRSLRLLAGYAHVLNDLGALATAELRHTVAMHMHELAGLAIAGDTVDAATRPGVRAARLRVIKSEVVADPGRRDLTASAIAERHGITTRYLHMLFADEGKTFSEFVLEQRLQYALRVLVDPNAARQSISAIAYAAGFGDLSYFNRTFRRLFGMTPSEARRSD